MSKKKKKDGDWWFSKAWRAISFIWLLAALPSPIDKPEFYIGVITAMLVTIMLIDITVARKGNDWLMNIKKKMEQK